MLKLLRETFVILLFTGFWIIINDGSDFFHFFLGLLVSFGCIFVTNRLLGFDYVDTFALPILRTIKYFIFTFASIYISGFGITYRIITGKISPNFVEVEIDKRIQNPFLHHIIGNSITLTPGTITVDNKNGQLVVLAIDESVTEPSKPFEKLLIKKRRK